MLQNIYGLGNIWMHSDVPLWQEKDIRIHFWKGVSYVIGYEAHKLDREGYKFQGTRNKGNTHQLNPERPGPMSNCKNWGKIITNVNEMKICEWNLSGSTEHAGKLKEKGQDGKSWNDKHEGLDMWPQDRRIQTYPWGGFYLVSQDLLLCCCMEKSAEVKAVLTPCLSVSTSIVTHIAVAQRKWEKEQIQLQWCCFDILMNIRYLRDLSSRQTTK